MYLKRLVTLFYLFIFVSLPAILFASIVGDPVICSMSLVDVWSWCCDHWVAIALVLSELLALLPGKWSGIVQSIINFGNALFKKKVG